MSLGMHETERSAAASTLAPAQDFPSLLAAAHTGAEWAWSAIYAELAPSVLGYLQAQRAPEPEDITGDLFLQVVRDLSGFDGDEAAFRAWVLTIAHHRLIDGRRYKSRRPAEAATTEIIVTRGPVGNGEDDGLEAVANAHVRELIGLLPESQRAVLLLRIVGGLTVEQVAGAIGRRPGAVKALQRRALDRLRKELSREGVPL
jgi:RNA polymerase sigma factor (sigma-70 family)